VIWRRKNWNRLNQMLDEGIRGEFRESRYDETELSRLECKWKQFLEGSAISKANLEKEKENIKSMISDISHQTKTPVANIRLYAELLGESLQKSDAPESQQNMAKQIQRQAEKLDFLMQSLTKMSRLESDIVAVRPVCQRILPLLEHVRQEALLGAKKKAIHLKLCCPEDFEVLYDAKWTSEALFNILDNAVKYSPEGGTVCVTAKAYELYGAVSVMDEGEGISEEEIPKIFGRFYRSEQVQQEEGVGIGLYLAREILRKQEGYIKVRSTPGKGSVFTVFLPKRI
jgi:two-component system sensor histidine kinase SenX3